MSVAQVGGQRRGSSSTACDEVVEREARELAGANHVPSSELLPALLLSSQAHDCPRSHGFAPQLVDNEVHILSTPAILLKMQSTRFLAANMLRQQTASSMLQKRIVPMLRMHPSRSLRLQATPRLGMAAPVWHTLSLKRSFRPHMLTVTCRKRTKPVCIPRPDPPCTDRRLTVSTQHTPSRNAFALSSESHPNSSRSVLYWQSLSSLPCTAWATVCSATRLCV